MKSILLLIAIFTLISCKDDSPTDKSDDQIQTEYTLEELENDSDWVEVTDIDTLEVPCLYHKIMNNGRVCKTQNEFESIFEENGEVDSIRKTYCNDATNFDIDFNKNTVILFSNSYLDIHCTRKIFKNQKLKQIVYFVKMLDNQRDLTAPLFKDHIVIPKIENDYTLYFDSLRVE